MPDPSSASIDFFISYTGTDKAWAEWVAWQLEHRGYKTLIQAWDFKSGGVFPGDMHRALQQSARVIAILTPAYMESAFCQPEWQAAVAADPTGEKGLLVCVRVADFTPDGLLRGRTYIDLVGKTEEKARELLLSRLDTARAKPTTPPAFPTTTAAASPTFPGVSSSTPAQLRTTIPHNLPTLQPFFGREDELAKIAEALEPESRTWGALIDGPGGMGKTSLAVRAAYAVPPGVFSKIVFVSLKTRELDDDGERDLSGFILSGLSELFGELASLLGHKDISKSAEDQRPRLLLDALAGTQTLLILDNLESLTKKERDIVFTFVKKLPPGCKAILTSRLRIGSGAEELMLQKLSEGAALQTLAELATHNPKLAETSEAERLVLYRETGGKPLLLRWTAGQIGRGHCLTFAHAIDYLRSCPKDNDPLEFIFGDLVTDFSPAETQALCALTYFTQPAKVEHIAEIIAFDEEEDEAAEAGQAVVPSPTPGGSDKGLPQSTIQGNTDATTRTPRPTHDELDRALRSLVNRSLAVPSAEYQTYTLVPLVADFMRQKKPQIVAETGSRLEKRAYALIQENGWKEHDRFPVLDAAWPSVAPAIPLFLAGPNARLQKICGALQRFLEFTGRWDEWLALCQQAEERALAAGDHDKAGWRAYHASRIHYARSQADELLACAERAAAHWSRALPPGSSGQAGTRELAIAINLRGCGHTLKQDYTAAIASYREVVGLHRSLSAESVDVAISLNDLASAERLSGDFDAAKRNFCEALRVAHAVGYAEGVATYTGNLAALALDQQDLPGAEALAREALPLAERVGRLEMIASDCDILAEVLERQGRSAEGLPHARRAVEIFTRLGSPQLAIAQKTLAACEAAAGGSGGEGSS